MHTLGLKLDIPTSSYGLLKVTTKMVHFQKLSTPLERSFIVIRPWKRIFVVLCPEHVIIVAYCIDFHGLNFFRFEALRNKNNENFSLYGIRYNYCISYSTINYACMLVSVLSILHACIYGLTVLYQYYQLCMQAYTCMYACMHACTDSL